MVKMKRYLIFCLCILIVFTSVRFDYVKVEAASESDIVQWLNSQKGKAIDFDGSYGVQCVDFFNYYLKNYWGYQNPIGMYPVSYAYQIFDRDQPSGWQKISGNSNFRTGDIVVWNSSVGKGAGHVGVIYSVDSSGVKVAHENWGAKYVTITSLPSVNSIRGVFRPPLTTSNPSSCNCSTSYAGTYTVITTQYPLNLRSGHGTNYSSITTIPIGAEVTVTKGDGSWAHVEWNGFSGYCAMEYLKKKSGTGNPIGTVDSLNGGANSISLAGWAFDSDDLNAGLEIHVYIGEECHPIVANLERKDVHNVYGCGNNHGFAATINTERTGRQNIRVYAINVGSGDNVLLMSKDVDISVDSNPPKITRTYVSEVTRDSYRVCAEISDDNGVKKVSIATWSQEKQADLIWRDAKYNGAGTYYIDISRSEHSQILNSFYYNHIYAYDYANNGARASQDMDYRVTSNTGKNISDGEYRIVSAADESKALNVLDEGTTAGTNIDINSNLSNKNQTFDITYIDNGFYKIIGHKSGLALDVNGDTYKLESNVVLSGYHDGMNQQWIFKKSSEGIYSIISRSTGMALDIYKGKYENGTNVEMYNVQDSDNQHWKLRRVLKENMVTFSDNNIYASNYTSYLDKVSVKVNGVKLKKNTDYKISCSKSGNVVRYEITGIGNYCDTVSKSVELKNEPTTSKPTQKPTVQPTTQKTTQKPTQRVTEQSTTQKTTQKPTQRVTEQSTTSKQTQKTTEQSTISKPTQRVTEQPTTQKTTQKPTQKVTEQPTTEKETQKVTEAKKYVVKFVDDDEIIDTQYVKEGMSATAPKLSKTGYTLSWDDDFNEVYEDMTINTEWAANEYKVKFNSAGGSVSEKTMQVTYDEEYGEMPEAERSGYLFDGWYTKKKGGTQVSEYMVVDTARTHTLYAHWEKVNVPDISIKNVVTSKKKVKVVMNTEYEEDGYQIMYSTNKNFRSYKKVTADEDTVTIKRLKSRTKYYIKARGYVYDSKDKKVYGRWSKVYKVSVK